MKNNKWNVMTLRCGAQYRDQALFTGELGAGNITEQPFWVTAIWNEEHKILFDTGVDDVEWVLNKFRDNASISDKADCIVADDELLCNKIAATLGWSADDVDIVFHSHLHWDHCCNDKSFKNAKFYIQRREWELATDAASPTGAYKPGTFDYAAVPYFDWVFLEGEAEILPGLIAFPTPGHTEGHQSLLVNTEEGVLCVSGDAVNLLDNIRMNMLPGICFSSAAQMGTYKAIRKRAEFIIPSHDLVLRDGQTGGFPSIR